MIINYVFIYVLLGKELQRYSEALTLAAPGENSQKNIPRRNINVMHFTIRPSLGYD